MQKNFWLLTVLIFSGGLLVYGPGTDSYFNDKESIDENSLSFGFWVPPEIKIKSPQKDDHWQIGAREDILWEADSTDQEVTDDMSIDISYKCGSGSWNDIVTDTKNDGKYQWIVPTVISDECKIKITATDKHGLTNDEKSDEFEISWMIVLNEFMPKPAVGKEWVEIYNNGDVAIDVNNWFITDNLWPGNTSHKRLIDNAHTDTGSTIIDPATSRFLVVANYSSFYLNNDGDEVRLYDKYNNLIDKYNYTSSEVNTGKTIARNPDGTGAWVDPVPTPGKKNDPSNKKKDFKKYYKKHCFSKEDKPLCEENFLKKLDLLEESHLPEDILPENKNIEDINKLDKLL